MGLADETVAEAADGPYHAPSVGGASPLPFHSILFDKPGYEREIAERQEPAFFPDLNLDQVLQSITASRLEYDLTPFFYTSLHSVEAIN